MNIVSGVTLFVIIWWPVFFCLLSVGLKQPEKGEGVEGQMPGAPENPDLKRKALWTTAISAVLWLLVYAVVKADVFSFRD
ncbi:MAG: DUF1467 family protein [Alphaproteobacteria bacterium]